MTSYDSTPPPPTEADKHQIAFGITIASGAVAAMLVAGWFGEPVRFGVALLVAVIGSLVAGWFGGADRDARAHVAGAAVVASIGITFATKMYVAGRSSVWNIELVLPTLVGSLPGLFAYFALRRLVARPQTRAAVSLGLAVTAALIALAVAPAPVEAPRARASQEPGSGAQLIGLEKRDELVALFGDKAKSLIKTADVLDSILQTYGPTGIARAGATGQRQLESIERDLAAMRADADRRIAAGEPASKFLVLHAVEDRIKPFLQRHRTTAPAP